MADTSILWLISYTYYCAATRSARPSKKGIHHSIRTSRRVTCFGMCWQYREAKHSMSGPIGDRISPRKMKLHHTITGGERLSFRSWPKMVVWDHSRPLSFQSFRDGISIQFYTIAS